MAKEQIRVRAKLGGEILLIDKSEWDKHDAEYHGTFDVLGTEEEEQAALIKQSIADSKRYDAAVAKSDKDGVDPANVAARNDLPPPKLEAESATTGLVVPPADGKKS